VERALAPTRTKAQALILAGRVRVGENIVSKMGALTDPSLPVSLLEGDRFVSRGGEKLDGALDDFKLDVRGLICLDVGASTGGFTDCLLQRGAAKVYAVDVGTNQLIDSLKKDSRVASFEQTHINDFNWPTAETAAFCVIDVSFIPLKKVLPKVKSLLPATSTVVAMIKPQFEVGAKFLKKGVVRSEEVRAQAVADVIAFAQQLEFDYVSQTPARIKGPKGNQEFFIQLKTK
jgi:23S rRNA (cytidine1920-2'-O)/16S rRNA (cytidine1409-2'-O)-methyltransferase